MRLSDQQGRYFDTFGFIKFPGLLANEIGVITQEFEDLWATHGSGHHGREHDRIRRSALVPFVDRSEYLSTLLDDGRIEGIAASVLGDDFNYTSSDGNFYVGDTAWHSDGYIDRKYPSVKMAFYLDPVSHDTGCLRVIPGSHRVHDGFAEDLQKVLPSSRESHLDEAWGVPGSEVPAVSLECEPGDLLMFNHSIKHASFGGGDRRRMFTMNFQKRYADEDLPALREDIGKSARFWVERAYGDVMVSTASPSRMRHLGQRLANDGHLAELSQKARRDMEEPSRS